METSFFSILAIILLAITCLFSNSKAFPLDPDVFPDMVDIVKSHKYQIETHKVTTKDGYILTIFRIPGKIGESSNIKRQPVYMQPGIFCSSEVFLAGGTQKGAAYFLVNHGYDVWIANSRGTRYSLEHVKYKRSDPEFWNFTFEEHGLYDQPAIMDYICEKTGFKKVHYWSHSMGGTQMFAALTLDPDYYRKRLLSAVMTGPPVRFDLTTSTFIQIMNFTKIPHIALQLGMYEFLPFSRPLAMALVILKNILPTFANLIVYIIADERAEIFDKAKSDIFFAHFPAGSSTKCFKHLVQLSEFCGFNRYRETMESPVIPYDFNNIPDDIPLAVFGGQFDMLSTPEENAWLEKELLKRHKKVYVKTFHNQGHIPFLAPSDENTQFLQEGLDFFAAAEIDYYQINEDFNI